MKVKVTLASIYREVAGAKELGLELPEGSTIKQLVDLLAERYGGPFKELLTRDGSINEEALLLLNGMRMKRSSQVLKDGDFVFITSELVGGFN